MALCDYERDTLSRIHFGKAPKIIGAAWFAACEALSEGGYVRGGKLTEKGLSALDAKQGKCNHSMVWVAKATDLDVPELDEDGAPTNEVEHFDVNFYRCKLCGYVRADAD